MHKKSTIINAVPCNAGDELLLRNAITLCKQLGFQTTSVLSNQVDILGNFDKNFDHWHDLEIAADLDFKQRVPEFARKRIARFSKRLASIISILARGRNYNKALAAIAGADVVFSSAGGYLNSRYGYTKRLKTFETILDMGKKLVLLPQSIGPFSANTDHTRLATTLNKATAVLVRDAQSLQNLENIGMNLARVRQLPDLGLATLENSKGPQLKFPSPSVLISVREWKYDIELDDLVAKFVRLAEHISGKLGKNIVFASTCQGVPQYIDDSKIAKRVVANCSPHLQSKMNVIESKLTCHEYINLAKKCELYVGMRLHGAIMSLQADIPAFAIGYEEKTREIFTDIGLKDCFVEILDPIEYWLSKLTSFLSDFESVTLKSRAAINNPEFLIESYASKIAPLLEN